MQIRAHLRKTLPALRSAYDKLLILAESIDNHISTIRVEIEQIPKEMITKWAVSDKDGKKRIVVDLFAQGMTATDERYLDRTHFTQHFLVMRSLLNSSAGQAFCQELGDFSTGLQEMRNLLEFKAEESKGEVEEEDK
jgi:hypothetical protein